MPFALAAVIMDIISVIFFMRLMKDDPRFRFARNPAFALFFSVAGVVVASRGAFGLLDFLMGSVFLMVLVLAVLCAPLCLLPLCAFSEWFGNLISLGGANNIRALHSCGKAEHAEREGDFDLAERYFLESMPADPDKANPEYAAVHLQYGEFLRKRERFAETAAQWSLAIRAGLDAEKEIVTAARLAEIMANNLKDHEGAAKVIKSILVKHPNRKDALSLQRRLEKMEDRINA
ncbi:MAG: hypothetical protein JXR97_12905 [Planctomycetes bacterium]|nr:hypothetical protein [Planctomycetota bacterium]